MTDPSWHNTTVLDNAAAAEELKSSCEGGILVGGSATLVRALTDLGLVDEYRLMIFPLILGSGKRLFDGAKRTKLQLADITRSVLTG